MSKNISRLQMNDRRKIFRFQVNDSVFGVINPSFDIICTILNISSNGIAFSFLAESTPVDDLFLMDLFQKGAGFKIKNIYCQTQSESLMEQDNPFSIIPMVRIGAKFINLSGSKLSGIQSLMTVCSAGVVADRRAGIDRRLLKLRRSRTRDHFNDRNRRNTSDRRMGWDRRGISDIQAT